jgi:hypothetical protein
VGTRPEIRELGIKQIEAPVRDLDDATMVRIMAEENIEWNTSPAVINETVLAVKKFLDEELAKCETWEGFSSDKNIRTILVIDSEPAFRKLKGAGIGRDTILKFLGGNWKQWMVQEALDTLKDETIDREAVESMPTLSHAQTFKKEIEWQRKSK